SKKGTGNKGMPEFIIYHKDHPDLLIVVELKADPKDHEGDSSTRNPVKYAVDGVLHYMDHLKKGFNVIGIAISGETLDELKYSSYYQLKGEDEYECLKHTKLNKMSDYIAIHTRTENIRTISEINNLAPKLNNYMRAKHLSED